MATVTTGPLWPGRNWAAQAGSGSIHDDDTATDLGFRGGTVPGDVHLNQFPKTLLKVFGDDWFYRGYLSMDFKFATVDKEPVQVFVEAPSNDVARTWMEREDGVLVCQGNAGIGNLNDAHLQHKDLRPCAQEELNILRRVAPGASLGEYDLFADSAKQVERFDAGLLSDPIDDFRTAGRFGGLVACPATFIQYLWGPPMRGLQPMIEDAVGLFGAIQIAHLNGPFMLDKQYLVRSEVVSVGQSPKTEYLWYDSIASSEGKDIASMRMQLRFMKASTD